MVKSIALGNTELATIVFNIPRWITSLWEDAAVNISTQKDRLAIEQNKLTFGGNLTEANTFFYPIYWCSIPASSMHTIR